MAVRSARIAARGMVFEALAAGPAGGELVILLHGFPQTADCWRPALTALAAAGYRAVAVKQRGYTAGAMPGDVAAYTIDELTADVPAFAGALGSERFHLVGHDFGGAVAWSVAAQHPERLRSLTVLSTPHNAALREALRGTRQRLQMSYISVIRLPGAAEWLVDAAGGVILENLLVATGLERAHARRYVAELRRLGPTGALNWYRAIGRGDRAAAGGPVSTGTLFVWGDHDVAFTRAAAELTEQHVTGPYHLVELTGAGHWIPEAHWEDIEDLVLEHLAAAAG